MTNLKNTLPSNMNKNENYEKLMKWVMQDSSILKMDINDIAYNIQTIDILNVITNQFEFEEFIKDLESRTGKKIYKLQTNRTGNRKKGAVKNFFNDHYTNLNEWELNFIRSVMKFNSYSEKQVSIIVKILNKYDKKYLSLFQSQFQK